MLCGQCGTAIENALVVARAVDDDVVVLREEIVRQGPLEPVGVLGRLGEWEAGFDKAGSEHVVIYDYSTDASSEQGRCRALSGTGGSGHLNEELGRHGRLRRRHLVVCLLLFLENCAGGGGAWLLEVDWG